MLLRHYVKTNERYWQRDIRKNRVNIEHQMNEASVEHQSNTDLPSPGTRPGASFVQCLIKKL